MRRIYVDNASTTQVSEAALAAMLPCFREDFGNPSSIYSYGREAQNIVDKSRDAVAKAIGALKSEIFFTSGGTESINWAIHSACEQRGHRGKHIISSAIEHRAVLATLEKLEKQGFSITLLIPDKYGQIAPEQLEEAIQSDTILISIMTVNNVVGTVLRTKELSAVAHKHNILFHTDAVQAVGHIPIHVRELGVDFLSLSAHKFHGPKGVGALFAKVGRFPVPFITGGGQEKGLRSGTENVPGIAGVAAAITEETANIEENTKRLTALRDRLIERTLRIPGARLTGDPIHRLPGHASFVFEGGKHAAYLINMLSDAGICASAGSACSASSKEAPHTLSALGYGTDTAESALRISFSRYNTEDEVDAINEKLPLLVAELRNKKVAPSFFVL